MARVAEDTLMWTFRFRLAKAEHIWWTFISVLLTLSLIMITFSFLVGNNGEAVSILALSTVTGIAIVRYSTPAWRSRHFIKIRWLVWTGPSRTAINVEKK
ncbi:hypothetical protein BDD12DRAFT_882993 [Trichophaea hybrida]|nr:hypothetical protein BDD12DRAFT_882993 [Trichophaea hybrida]